MAPDIPGVGCRPRSRHLPASNLSLARSLIARNIQSWRLSPGSTGRRRGSSEAPDCCSPPRSRSRLERHRIPAASGFSSPAAPGRADSAARQAWRRWRWKVRSSQPGSKRFTVTRTTSGPRNADPEATDAGVEAGLILMSVRLNAGVAHRVNGTGTKDTIFSWGRGGCRFR